MPTPRSAGSPESNRGEKIVQPRATLRSWAGVFKEEPNPGGGGGVRGMGGSSSSRFYYAYPEAEGGSWRTCSHMLEPQGGTVHAGVKGADPGELWLIGPDQLPFHLSLPVTHLMW